ncbi:hypothetical protein BpHYR1_006351 [Brachionus plicatilis]|uniref:Uncharacterized protein n=1 Tax=Brachionus plicatilis TaxID=10195 RepID=A0A3M7PDW9_BRAPC|nr:hypothetical protein BpHYR1_006351 [Brachionus plicatilis]
MCIQNHLFPFHLNENIEDENQEINKLLCDQEINVEVFNLVTFHLNENIEDENQEKKYDTISYN